MPYKSQAQAGYFHTHKKQLAAHGVDVKEWDAATKGRSLPKRVAKKPKKWMQGESEREESAGTKGTFSAAAERAGQSTRDFAEEKKHAAGKTGKRARMALMFMGSKK